MLAAKFFDDQYFNNAYYAKVRLLGSGSGALHFDDGNSLHA